MAIVVVSRLLEKQIDKKFKKESVAVLESIYQLKDNPKKGKHLGRVGNTAIRELKYKNFRFYFLVDNYRVKVLDISELHDLIIKFVRMSDKKQQEKIIEEIKETLKKIGKQRF